MVNLPSLANFYRKTVPEKILLYNNPTFLFVEKTLLFVSLCSIILCVRPVCVSIRTLFIPIKLSQKKKKKTDRYHIVVLSESILNVILSPKHSHTKKKG